MVSPRLPTFPIAIAVTRGQKIPQPFGYGDHPLADGNWRNDVINQVRGRLSHASAVARWADALPLTREGDQKIVTAGTAAGSGESKTENAAAEVRPKLFLDEGLDWMLAKTPLGEACLEVPGDDTVERRSLGAASGVVLWLAGRSALPDRAGRRCERSHAEELATPSFDRIGEGEGAVDHAVFLVRPADLVTERRREEQQTADQPAVTTIPRRSCAITCPQDG